MSGLIEIKITKVNQNLIDEKYFHMAKYSTYEYMLSAYLSTIFLPPILPLSRLFLACFACSFDSSLPAMMMMYPPGIFPAGLPGAGARGGSEVICHYAAMDLGRERGEYNYEGRDKEKMEKMTSSCVKS